MFRKFSAVAVCAGVLAVVALAQNPNQAGQTRTPGDENNIVRVAKRSDNLNTFTKLVREAGLAKVLEEKGPYTVFAPTDEAFNKLGKEKLESLQEPENRAELRSILEHHIRAGKFDAQQLESLREVKCLSGHPLQVTVKDKTCMVDTAKVTKADIKAENGLIHEIDTVLIPPTDNQPSRTPAGGHE